MVECWITEARGFMSKRDDPDPQSPRGQLHHGFRAASFLLAHTAVALIFSAAIFATHWFFKWIGDPKLLDLFPVRYVFELGEIGVLIFFVIGGTLDARDAFKRPPPPPDRRDD
jgi:hypothetical protein